MQEELKFWVDEIERFKGRQNVTYGLFKEVTIHKSQICCYSDQVMHTYSPSIDVLNVIENSITNSKIPPYFMKKNVRIKKR